MSDDAREAPRPDRDLWGLPAHERRAIVQPAAADPAGALRPRDMLNRYGLDRAATCGTCRHFKANRCRKAAGDVALWFSHAWRADWYACGAWEAPDAPAPAPDQPAQSRLF
jgi:hypothetical protein